MRLRYGASAFIIAAGLIYLVIAPLHWRDAPALRGSSVPTSAAPVVNPVNAITNSTPVESSPGETTGSAPVDESTPDDLQLVVAGFASPFSNGSEIPVAGDLVAQVTVTPGDERYGRDVELYLYHQTSSQPLDDATIQVEASMRYMEHGTFQQSALNLGDGYYILLLPFPMPGEWQLELQIVTLDAPGTIRLDINLFE